MIEITVDYNNDYLDIRGVNPHLHIPIDKPDDILLILNEILNRINPIDVKLIKEDEDTRRTIGEW